MRGSVAAFVHMLVAMRLVRIMRFVRRIGFDMIAKGSNVQRIFVRGVGFRLGHRLRRAYDFLNIVIAIMFLFVLIAFMFLGCLRSFVLFVQLLFVVFILLDFRG